MVYTNDLATLSSGSRCSFSGNAKRQGRPISTELNVNITLYESVKEYICDMVIKSAQQQECVHLLSDSINTQTAARNVTYSMNIYKKSLHFTTDTNINSVVGALNNNHQLHEKKIINLKYKNVYSLKKNRKILSKPFQYRKVGVDSSELIPEEVNYEYEGSDEDENVLLTLKKKLLLESHETLGCIRAFRSPGGKVTKFEFLPLHNNRKYSVKDFKKICCYPRYKSHMRVILVKTNVDDLHDQYRPIKFFLNYKEYLHETIWENKSLINDPQDESYLEDLDGNKNTEVWVFHSSF